MAWVFLLALGVLLLGVTAAFAPVSAQEGNTISNCPDPVRSGQTYSLGDNLSSFGATCFNVDVDNVTIEGNGHSITGSGDADAIKIGDNVQNVTVRDVTIESWDRGVTQASGSDDVVFENVTVVDTRTYAFALSGHVELNDTAIRDEDATFGGLRIRSQGSVSATDFDLGASTSPETTLDFEAENVTIDAVDSAPSSVPDGVQPLDRYVSAEGLSGGTFSASLHYEDADVEDLDEGSIELYREPDGGAWTEAPDQSLDQNQNLVTTSQPDGGYDDDGVSTFGAYAVVEEPFKNCRVLDTPGTYYLEKNLTTSDSPCLDIAAHDVTIDGQGHEIEAVSSDNIRIVQATSSNPENLTVRNLTVRGGYTGIDAAGTFNTTIHDVTVTDSRTGIKLDQGTHRARDVTFRGTTTYALEVSSATLHGDRIHVGDSAGDGANVSLSGTNFGLIEYSDPGSHPEGQTSLDQFLDVGYVQNDLSLDFHYTEAATEGVDESTIALWEYNNGDWQDRDDSLYTENRTVSTSYVSEPTGQIGVFATPTPHFDVTANVTDDAVPQGENVTVEATVENVGGTEDSQSVTLHADDDQLDAESVSLAAGENTTIPLEWDTSDVAAGEYDLTVKSENDSDVTSVTVQEPANVTVTAVEADSSVAPGETVSVDATLLNEGGAEDTQTVELLIDDDATATDSTDVTIGGGNETTVRLEWQTTSDDRGTHVLNVTTEDDHGTATVDVDARPNLTVDVLEYDETVVGGDSLSVTANVTNVGDREASQELNLTVNESVGEVENASVTVQPGTYEHVPLAWQTDPGDAGDYSAEFHSENDSDAVDVRVDAPPNLTVDILEYDETVVEGDSLSVTANVTNVGDRTANQELNLTVNESVGEVGNTSVTVPNGTSQNVTLSWETDRDDAGDYSAEFHSENDSDAVDVRVDAPPHLSVAIPDLNDAVYENETLPVNATVENLGDVTAQQTIALNVSSTGSSTTEQIANTTVTVDGGNATNVSLDWPVDGNATGANATLDYTATVASENHTASADVAVRDDRAYFVSIDDVASPVTEGDNVTVDATVSAHDGAGEAKNVSLSIGETERNRTNVTLSGNDSKDVTLTWATTDGDAGDYTATVASEDHSADTSVTVESPLGGGGLLPPGSGTGSDPTLDVAIEGTNEPVRIGDPVVVSVRLSNGDDGAVTDDVSLSARGSQRDGRTVTLDADENRTIDLEWATTAEDAGSHPVTVATGGSSDVRYVEVVEEPAFDVEIEETNGPIDAGRTLHVTASVAATVDDTQTVALETPDGRTVDSESVSLAAGESTTVGLAWDTGLGDATSGDVTVRGRDDAASTGVRIRRAVSSGEVGVSLERLDTPLTVNESGGVMVAVQNDDGSERTFDLVLEVDGTERAVETVTLASGQRQSVVLSWMPGEDELGERAVTVRAGENQVSESVTVEEASGGLLASAPQWAGSAVDYEPTEQDTHVGGFLWLTALIGGVGVALLVTRSSLESRLLSTTLLVAAFRTSTDVVHATIEDVATHHLLALNTSLELYVGLLFLAFTAAYVDDGRLLQRRSLLAITALGVAGTAAAATNPSHGLVFGEVSLVGGPFTYVTAENGPLGWALLALTLTSLLASVGLLVQSFLAGTNPAWRPVGVLASGLCLALVVVLLSVFERGPLPQYDYTGAGVGGFLVVATSTAVGHGLHRITHDAQKSLIQDLDDPIVFATDARVVVEFNAAAAEVLPGIDEGVSFDDLVTSTPNWPAPGETTAEEYSRSALVASSTATDAGPNVAHGDARTDGAGREPPAGDVGPAAVTESGGTEQASDGTEQASGAHEQASDDTEQAPGAHEQASDGTEQTSGAHEQASDGTEQTSGAHEQASDGTEQASGAHEQSSVPHENESGAEVVDSDPEAALSSDGDSDDDVHYLVQTTSVTADTGDSIGYTVRFTDVTELKRRTDELTRRNAQLEQVASTISHDLRNPMTVADGYVEMLQDSVPASGKEVQPASVSQHLEPVRESLSRMDEIIADILALARSNDPVSPERLAFGPAVEEAWATVDTGPATLFVESSGHVTADPGHLRRILENLFRNAVEHAGPDVAVLVGLTEDGFYVADDGPGIPEDRQADVFEEGHTSNPDGTGLGLSIVSELAQAQDWDVHLDTEYSGARFVLTGCQTETDGTGPASNSGAN